METARDLTVRLRDLLRNEHGALADVLLTLATFDERRLWAQLEYGSLFDFLHRELGLSKGAAFYRKTAVGLVREFPAVAGALRDGKLCVMTVVEIRRDLWLDVPRGDRPRSSWTGWLDLQAEDRSKEVVHLALEQVGAEWRVVDPPEPRVSISAAQRSVEAFLKRTSGPKYEAEARARNSAGEQAVRTRNVRAAEKLRDMARTAGPCGEPAR